MEPMTLTIIFFLIYIAIVVAIGIISARKESEDGFMIAERKVEGVQVAATMSAGFFDGATLSIYVAFLYLYGFSAIWLFVGIALGFLFVRKYAHKIKQKADELKVYTMPEYFFKILGKKNGLMFSFFLVLQFFLLLIVNLVISGKVLSAIFPIPYFVAVIIGGFIVAPDLWQRIFATKDERNLKRGLGYSAVILLVLGIVISVVGLATKQLFPNIVPEDALVTGFSHLLPFGLKEFGMVLLYAVALSSSDTVTFVISSIFTRDLKNYSKKYSEESMKKLTRFFMVFFIAIAVIIGIFYQNILALGFSLASLNLALFPIVFGSLYWKLKEKAVFWSLILGFISIAVLFVANQLNPQNAVISLPVVLFSLLIFQKLFKKSPLQT